MRKTFGAIALLLVAITGKAQEYYFDSETEKTISTLLQSKVNEIKGNGGEVYVMETQTGKIIAKVKSGNTTDNEELDMLSSELAEYNYYNNTNK